MSKYDYLVGREISAMDPPFAALIFAALRKADTTNAARIRAMWPELAAEAQARYDAPGGVLAGDEDPPVVTVTRLTPEDVQRMAEEQDAAWEAMKAHPVAGPFIAGFDIPLADEEPSPGEAS